MSVVDRREIVMARSIEYGYNPNIGLNGLVSVKIKMLDTVVDYGRIIECIMQIFDKISLLLNITFITTAD